jgi:hypothetical protein
LGKEDFDHRQPEVVRLRFHDQKPSAADYFDEDLAFESGDCAGFVKLDHFLCPEYGVLYKVLLAFLDVDHPDGLEEGLEAHFVRVFELEEGVLKVLGEVNVEFKLSFGVYFFTEVEGKVPDEPQGVNVSLDQFRLDEFRQFLPLVEELVVVGCQADGDVGLSVEQGVQTFEHFRDLVEVLVFDYLVHVLILDEPVGKKTDRPVELELGLGAEHEGTEHVWVMDLVLVVLIDFVGCDWEFDRFLLGTLHLS